MSAFATADDLATALGRTLSTEQTEQVDLLLDLATAVIKSWTRQDIEKVEGDTVLLPGTWGPDLDLPQSPVLAVSAVSFNGVALGDGEWTWNERNLIRRGFGARAFDYPPGAFVADPTLIDWPLQQSGFWHWGGPAATIEVTYDHGYDPVPDDVRAMCLSLSIRAFVNPAGAVMERIGSYEITYDQAARARAAGMALTTDDQQALRKYRRWWL